MIGYMDNRLLSYADQEETSTLPTPVSFAELASAYAKIADMIEQEALKSIEALFDITQSTSQIS